MISHLYQVSYLPSFLPSFCFHFVFLSPISFLSFAERKSDWGYRAPSSRGRVGSEREACGWFSEPASRGQAQTSFPQGIQNGLSASTFSLGRMLAILLHGMPVLCVHMCACVCVLGGAFSKWAIKNLTFNETFAPSSETPTLMSWYKNRYYKSELWQGEIRIFLIIFLSSLSHP